MVSGNFFSGLGVRLVLAGVDLLRRMRWIMRR